jgi:hypothetical protein
MSPLALLVLVTAVAAAFAQPLEQQTGFLAGIVGG